MASLHLVVDLLTRFRVTCADGNSRIKRAVALIGEAVRDTACLAITPSIEIPDTENSEEALVSTLKTLSGLRYIPT